MAYNIAKINKRLLDEAKIADDIYQGLVKEYCNKDENGEIVPHDGRPNTFVIPEEKADEWGEKLKEFHSISFEIDRPKILLDDVQGASVLSPLGIMILEPVLEYDESEPAALSVVK